MQQQMPLHYVLVVLLVPAAYSTCDRRSKLRASCKYQTISVSYTLIGQGQLSEGIVLVHVDPGVVQHQLWLDLVQQLGQGFL